MLLGGFLAGGLCNNENDFATMDAVSELSPDELLTVPHEDPSHPEWSWCFNVNSLFALWTSGTAGSYKNPWTNLPWTPAQRQVIEAKFAQVGLVQAAPEPEPVPQEVTRTQ
jgi:hypothetical protein